MTPDQLYAALKKYHFRLDQFTSWLGDDPEFASLINHLRKLARGDREGLPAPPIQRGFQPSRPRITSDQLDWPERFDAALYVIEGDNRTDERTIKFINDIIEAVDWKSCDNKIADSFHAAFAIPILNILLITNDLITNIVNIVVGAQIGSFIETDKILDEKVRNAVSVLQNQFSQEREYDAGERAMRRGAFARVLGLPAEALEDKEQASRAAAFLMEALDAALESKRYSSHPIIGKWTQRTQQEESTGVLLAHVPPQKPETAPAQWAQDRLQGETPVDFVERVYQPWLEGSAPVISRADLRGYKTKDGAKIAGLDPALDAALEAWLNEHGLPEGRRVPPPSWKEAKQPGDTPVSFIQRHYGPWLGKGLSRPDIKRLDPGPTQQRGGLYQALGNWLRNNTLPDGFKLPTKSEAIDEKLAASGTSETPEGAREWWRLQHAKRNRTQRTSKR